ncbi:alpha/beta fold hydrolase [Roseivivax sp. CAU 1761]
MTEPLVLIAGLGCDARLWGAQITDLSRHRPVTLLCADGGDRIEDMASAALPLLPPRFALAGHGLGGAVAMEMLRRAPERVARIALIAASPLAETPAEAAAREPRLIAVRAGRLGDAVAAEIPAEALAPGPDRGYHAKLLRAMAQALGAATLMRQIRAQQRRRDQQAVLRNCRAPALVLCGGHDRLAPAKHQKVLADMIPSAAFEVLEAAGHLAPLEAPEAVTQAFETWLARPAAPRQGAAR